jgi:hypothetical protein
VLEVVDDPPDDDVPDRAAEEIGLVARLVEPFAVFVRA